MLEHFLELMGAGVERFEIAVSGAANEPVGTNDMYGLSLITNRYYQALGASGTNFGHPGVWSGIGSQRVVVAVRDLAGNTRWATNVFTVRVYTNAAYAYNAAGCLTGVVMKALGCTNSVRMDWDGAYRLTAVYTNGGAAERNGYDALDRRVWTWSGGATNYSIHLGSHIVADVDVAGNPVRTYTYGPGMDNLLAMTVHTGATTRTYYYVTDHLGSVHALVDEYGRPVESYRFDAWGRLLTAQDSGGVPLKTSAIGNRFLWQGREYSWASGLYYFRARWYDPVIGRWLSKDPIGIAGGLNQYVFCSNNPVNVIDPLGLFGIQFGEVNIGIGDPSLVFDDSSWMDISRGSAATLDGIIPFADPFAIAYTDDCGKMKAGTGGSRALGAVSRDIYTGRVALRGLSWLGSTRFGHFLNHNRWLRIGPGRMPPNGSMPGGPQVPRVSIGPQRPGVSNPHIDLRASWEVP